MEKEHSSLIADMIMDMNKYIESYLPPLLDFGSPEKKIVNDWISEKAGEWLVLAIDEKIIGFFQYTPYDTIFVLNNIYIQKEHRGKGYARKVIDFITLEAEKVNASHIEVCSYLTPSLNTYKSMGFIPCYTTLYKPIKERKHPCL